MVHIIADTTSCLSPQVARQYAIPIIPQVIHFRGNSYLEGVDLNAEQFLAMLRENKSLPKTAAPPPELFVKEFERLVPSREPILCIHPSSEVSGTVRSAQVAAMEFPGADIRVVDTRLVASPLGTVVERAAVWAAAGEPVDELERKVKEFASRGRIYFLVPTLEYLARGGRIGGAAALVGGVLQVKPILTFVNGQVSVSERVRTHKHALARMKEIALSQVEDGGTGGKGNYFTVLHAGVPEAGQALAEDLQAALHVNNVPVYNMPPAIVTHGGPGILGIGFFVDPVQA